MRKTILIILSIIVVFIISIILYAGIILGDLTIFIPHGGKLLGFNREEQYLILFQNNNELRPSGGFISAYGILSIKNGKLNLDFADSYNLPKTDKLAPAPEPFNIMLESDDKFLGWYFRDGNFDVDFRKAARDTERLFWEQSGRKKSSFDGVFAVNFEFLEQLVEIYDLEINNTKINKANLFSVLEHEVKNIDTHDIEELKNRKNILADLASKLMAEALYSPFKHKDLFNVLTKGLNQKMIVLNFKDTALQELIEEKGWAGKFDPDDYDNFIYSNIANIGGRKSDRYIQKRHEYFVSFDKNERGFVTYNLTIKHFGTYNLNSDIYKAYVKLSIPTESEYMEEYVEIKPGEEKTLTFNYFLPQQINKKKFNLDLIKQPGTNDFWSIIVQLPTDQSIVSKEFETRENVSFWSGYLREDKRFDFEFVNDSTPPLIIWQRMIEQNLIEIGFNEALDESLLLNPENYEIEDLNFIDSQTDEISVDDVYFKNNVVYLKTSGISFANEERYKIILKNLEDMVGNTTKPEKLEVTVVQRY